MNVIKIPSAVNAFKRFFILFLYFSEHGVPLFRKGRLFHAEAFC